LRRRRVGRDALGRRESERSVSGVDRVAGLEGDSSVRSFGKAGEEVFEGHKRFPRLPPARCGEVICGVVILPMSCLAAPNITVARSAA
jgi:hypothetical protein